MIVYHSALGELDKAVELIENEYERGADWVGGAAYDPWYAAVGGDPRIESILKQVHAIR